MIRLAVWLCASVLLLASFAAAGRVARDQELEDWVRRLDAAREPEWSQALEHLTRLGEPAALRVLADFETLGFSARRARAKLLVQIPSPALCARVLGLLADPDPQVRRLLALVLGNPALAEAAAPERVQALERLLLDDPNEYVRNKAREALIECALEGAVPALDRALEHLPPGEAERVAAGLTQIPAGRERVIARLSGASGAGRLPDGVQAALLQGYGRILAEVPGGGEQRRERLPFLLGRAHLSSQVQAAARLALTGFVARAAELSESERAERVLARLGEEGWPPLECLRRRLDLAWLERGDAGRALELAQALERAAQSLPAEQAAEEAEAWSLRARLFQGAALYVLGERTDAQQLFDALCVRLEASLARRADLFPGPRGTEGGGSAHIERLHLFALVRLWRALLALGASSEEGAVLSELRAAHVLFLESRVVAMRTGAPDPSSLDSLFDRDLSPYTLVLFNERLEPAQRGPALDRALALGRAWGRVAPLELQGLEGEPPSARRLGDVFFDAQRLALLKELRAAELAGLQRQLDELDEPPLPPRDADARNNAMRFLLQRGIMLRTAESEEAKASSQVDPQRAPLARLRSIYAQLLEYLTPCMHAHTLAGELRAEGRSSEARTLCEQALATLRTAPLGSSTWSELSSARFELLRGSCFMDEERPREAEQAYLESERRLEAIEKLVEEWRQTSVDPESARQYETQIRSLRGDALLSLAVNANVRMHDPARALAYFERAYELNQSPFMRILRACYRARSGLAEEARTVLSSVVPVPSLYYNIACTHALLGDKGAALDYLERDLRENHPTAGSLAQKREWARKDPDLASLRGEPRFERLLGGS